MTPIWTDGEVEAPCPACGDAGVKRLLVDVPSRVPADVAATVVLSFARCAACGSVFVVGARPPSYESGAAGDAVVQYYVEHLAAIDTMVDPLFALDRARVRRYVEVGCSFGFGPDFARTAFGWTVRAVDPSPLAALGGQVLGLPIEGRYFSEAEPLDGEPADLVVASEVIEHVGDPHAFMRGVVASAARDAVVVVSTPNAAAVAPGTGHGALIQVLCPGYHLVLFSEAALRGVMAACGLVHQQVRATATGLTIFASAMPFAFDAGARTARADYVDYLRARLDGAPAGSALESGMLYRLVREFAMFAQWEAAEALMPRLVAGYARRGADLVRPEGCRPRAGAGFTELAAGGPLNLGGVFYALGMLAMLHRGDGPGAAACFEASVAWFAAVRRALGAEGSTDAEADLFERLGREHVLMLGCQVDPLGAVERFGAMKRELAGEAGGAAVTEALRVALAGHLVNVGRGALLDDAPRPAAERKEPGMPRRWLRRALGLGA